MAKWSLNDMKYIIEEASKMVLNEITVKDASSVEVECYDGKRRTVKLK